MTYCLGMLLNEGLVMIADTRTNAGVDNFSSYKKLHMPRRPARPADLRLHVGQPLDEPVGDQPDPRGLAGRPTATRLCRDARPTAPRCSGSPSWSARRSRSPTGRSARRSTAIKLSSSVSLLLGGRIGKKPPQLFQVYSAGNFIQCKPEAPFLQIGETKYGKPILDRGIEIDTPLDEAVKVGFLSFDSAMRSNLGVGPAARHDGDAARSEGADPDPADRARRRIFQRAVAALVDPAPRGDAAIPNPPFMQPDGKAAEAETSKRRSRPTLPSRISGRGRGSSESRRSPLHRAAYPGHSSALPALIREGRLAQANFRISLTLGGQSGGGFGVERRREEEALAVAAAELAKQGELGLGLDMLGDAGQAERGAELEHALEQSAAADRVGDRGDQAAVELDPVELHLAKIGDGGVAGAEIVEDDPRSGAREARGDCRGRRGNRPARRSR